ncbi:transcriptional regulator, BadM/Rrf2 family [Candidatus Thermokryptus mobilis]|uniref:Transcriptional regulator, BadM/Rrf2 family n=1 Tax=Candidatus Thermokryptus mobilis TaxID=1643428 RepID=A0A0S4MQI6_9BACT|nr:Rrf2 family transcriptional regulator [Candidatus Thermokryptus mobilis]CUU00643.1 transcriptional regulator, BadM/Rrf2 family [Candidatus Thermokryptus mobilis]
MPALLSKTTEYGIRAVLYIALNSSKYITTKEIAKELKIPKHFLAKVIQKLVRSKIIYSRRGRNGGFVLRKSPDKLKIIDVVLALEGDELFKKCVLGLPNCSDENPCSVHQNWSVIREQIKQMLSERTLKELLDGEVRI